MGDVQQIWAQRRLAFKQLHVQCVTSQDERMRELAEPIQAVLEKIDEVKSKPPTEQRDLIMECDRLMFQLQGIGVLAYLDSLTALRDTIAAQAARAPEGPVKKKLQMAQAAHEEAINLIGAAYEALREGKKDRFDEAQRKLFALQPALQRLYEKA